MALNRNGTADSTQTKVSVRGLWKIFGSGIPTELTDEMLNRSKAELREEWVCET